MAPAQIPDSTDVTGGQLNPFVLRLADGTEMTPLPPWMPGAALIRPDLDLVEIPVPALFSQPQAERFALTVIFEDSGDGGPAVEWRRHDGSSVVVSEGLGDVVDNRNLGLNARTVLLPRELTETGGTVIVSYYDRLKALTSVVLAPAREGMVAVVGPRHDPSLVDASLQVLEGRETDGRRRPPLTGDLRHGMVVEAELAAAIEALEDAIEFVVPLEGVVNGVVLKTEALGLDPEAAVEVTLNGARLGTLAMAPFALDDPVVTEDPKGRLVVAGWRDGSFFLAPKYWQAGDNHLVLRLVRSRDESARPVFLRNSILQVRFGPEPSGMPTLVFPPAPSPTPDESLPKLGSLLDWESPVATGEASSDDRMAVRFLEPEVIFQAPRPPPLPTVITSP